MTENESISTTMVENGPKVLRVRFADGSVWDIPAQVIAHDRARYYEAVGESYALAFDAGMADDAELMEWASGNMDWSDVAMVAQRQMSPPANYAPEWVNAPKEIVNR